MLGNHSKTGKGLNSCKIVGKEVFIFWLVKNTCCNKSVHNLSKLLFYNYTRYLTNFVCV